MSLQDRLDALRAKIESGNPPFNMPRAVVETMHRATQELIQSGQASRAKRVGELAPSFTLDAADGEMASLSKMLAGGPVVISFYRGVWCPYCNLDLEALQAALPEIAARGAKLIAISPQNTPNSRKTIQKLQLQFPILSDPRGQVSDAYGLRYEFPDYLVDLYRNVFKNDLSKFNNDHSWTLPMPARFIVGTDSVIVYAEVNPDYTRRPDPSELLPILESIKSRSAA